MKRLNLVVVIFLHPFRREQNLVFAMEGSHFLYPKSELATAASRWYITLFDELSIVYADRNEFYAVGG